MHEPDIPLIEVQQSMARIREATSKTQEAPAKILNKEMAKDLPAEFKITLFPFRFFFLDKRLIFSTSFIQILDTFRRNISLDQLSISTKRYMRPVVLYDQMSYSTKSLSANSRGSLINNETDCGRVVLYTWLFIFTSTSSNYKKRPKCFAFHKLKVINLQCVSTQE